MTEDRRRKTEDRYRLKQLIIKSFCGVQGRFFQKEPLAAGGISIKFFPGSHWQGVVFGRRKDRLKIGQFVGLMHSWKYKNGPVCA